MEVDIAGSLATGSGEQEADGGTAWPAEALIQLCGRGRRVWAALHGPCNMLVWWSLRHGGVTGSGHDRHCAVGTDAVWCDVACVKRIRRHRGGALAPPLMSGFGRFGEVGSGARAPPLRRRIRLNRLYSLQSLSYSTDRCLSCLIPTTPPCHGAHQNSMPAQQKSCGKSRPADALQLQQTFASLMPPACSLRSDQTSGGRTDTARNQRLALLQPASPSPPARWEPMSDR